MPLTKFDFFPVLSIQLNIMMKGSAAFITRGNANRQRHLRLRDPKELASFAEAICTKINTPPTLERVSRCGKRMVMETAMMMGTRLHEFHIEQGIGLKIAMRRRRLHWSQTQLAITIGCSRQTITAYESGECSIPAARLKRILHALRVDANFVDLKQGAKLPAPEGDHHGDLANQFGNRGRGSRPRAGVA